MKLRFRVGVHAERRHRVLGPCRGLYGRSLQERRRRRKQGRLADEGRLRGRVGVGEHLRHGLEELLSAAAEEVVQSWGADEAGADVAVAGRY